MIDPEHHARIDEMLAACDEFDAPASAARVLSAEVRRLRGEAEYFSSSLAACNRNYVAVAAERDRLARYEAAARAYRDANADLNARGADISRAMIDAEHALIDLVEADEGRL